MYIGKSIVGTCSTHISFGSLAASGLFKIFRMGLRRFFKNLFALRVKADEIVSEDIIIVYVFSMGLCIKSCLSINDSVIGPTGAGKSSVSSLD
jgi:hypothetical protein